MVTPFAMRVLSAMLAMASVFAPEANAVVTSNLFRTYLSVDGNDGNPCTVSAPCRLLPAALAATQAAGEVWILDSANYNTGAVSIAQSVTVLAVPGVEGSLVANGSTAVTIGGSSAIAVTLRNLVLREIDGQTTNEGILVQNASASVIIDTVHFSSFSVAMLINTWAKVDISKSVFERNYYAFSTNGSTAAPSSGAQSSVTIIDTTFRQNTESGIFASNAAVSLNRDTFSNNGNGILFAAGSNVLLNDNVIVGNGYGIADYGNEAGAYAYSTGTNVISDNSTNVFGTLSKISQQ